MSEDTFLEIHKVTMSRVNELPVFCNCGFEAESLNHITLCPKCGVALWHCFAINTIRNLKYKYSGKKCPECEFRFICYSTSPYRDL